MKIKPTGAFRGPGSARRSGGFRMAGPSSPVEAGAEPGFRDNKTWQEAMDLAEKIFRFTETWKGASRTALAAVLRESAAEIPAMAAYAHTLVQRDPQLEALQGARAELSRLEALIELAGRLGYCAQEENAEWLKSVQAIGVLLTRQIQRMEAQRAVAREETP